ncbi:hypothetical protein MIND_01191900 [Mycena indigotica]|uniref:Uncharacterized protein n=1 Tax=Mycena indigotica TaxID=2126181 RepID=A0A8H6S5W9_9AGAR|nr:uncharacterized protein MIND_01191900 [Mycena indigotica]KAF7292928.1 hypothetical protein MIND_01191900 [Mycena indigotica]
MPCFRYGTLFVWSRREAIARPMPSSSPAIIFFGWSNALYMTIIVLQNSLNLSFRSSLPDLLLPTLRFLSNLAGDWALVLLFLAIHAVVFNRETALHKATEGKSGGHHPALIALHVTFASLLFILGTAAEGYTFDTNVKFYNTTQFRGTRGRQALRSRISTGNSLFYAFQSFVILSFIDILATSIVLWRGWRRAGISDRVTNVLFYVITPLYCFMALFTMIFTIVFSPNGLPDSASLSTLESANLASVLLTTLCSIGIIIVILVASVKKGWWGEDEFKYPPQQQLWVPQQPQYVYATAPAPGAQPQPGYSVPQPAVTPAGYYVSPAQTGMPQPALLPPMAPGPASPYSYSNSSPSSPGPMESTVGGYTPPHSEQGVQPAKPGKGGMHLATI